MQARSNTELLSDMLVNSNQSGSDEFEKELIADLLNEVSCGSWQGGELKVINLCTAHVVDGTSAERCSRLLECARLQVLKAWPCPTVDNA